MSGEPVAHRRAHKHSRGFASTARRSLELFFSLPGKAQPFRSSGGLAALEKRFRIARLIQTWRTPIGGFFAYCSHPASQADTKNKTHPNRKTTSRHKRLSRGVLLI